MSYEQSWECANEIRIVLTGATTAEVYFDDIKQENLLDLTVQLKTGALPVVTMSKQVYERRA